MLNKALLLAIVTVGLAASAASAGEFGAYMGLGPGGQSSASWDPVSGVVESSGYLYARNDFSPGELDNPTGYTLIHPSMWWRDVNVGLYSWGFNGGLPFEDYSSDPYYPIKYVYAPVRPEDFGDGGIPFTGDDFGSGELPVTDGAAAAAVTPTPEPVTMAFFCVTGIALLKRRSR